jgi:hypothetical protein
MIKTMRTNDVVIEMHRAVEANRAFNRQSMQLSEFNEDDDHTEMLALNDYQ